MGVRFVDRRIEIYHHVHFWDVCQMAQLKRREKVGWLPFDSSFWDTVKQVLNIGSYDHSHCYEVLAKSGLSLKDQLPGGSNKPIMLGEALMATTVIYVKQVLDIINKGGVKAHITFDIISAICLIRAGTILLLEIEEVEWFYLKGRMREMLVS
ncbi:uncharacterized protein LOC131221594 [Magnolia sinica]|uniref:uncharacterized protein LOC131221594 n=1 Tax=Magnolia sinica TaxID=86752 RepID=UPI002659D8C8|nr:uncharacterized protein LOC131221594 [Magnolia sinica]